MNIIPGASIPVPGHTWLYLAVPCRIRLYPQCIIPKASLPVPGILVCTWNTWHTGLYLAVPGRTWPYQAVPGCTQLYLAVSGCN